MYGTIAKLHSKPGMESELERLSREEQTEISGITFQYVYRMDDDPQDLFLVVGFESKESYRKNAESPEQHARYLTMISLLESEPEWHDGEIVFSVQS